jgi:peptidoglycan-associated lipoprotein
MGCPPPENPKPEAPPQPPKTATKDVKETPRPSPATSLKELQTGEAPKEGPLKNIYFAFDKYDLSTEARATLKSNADWLKANPTARVEVEGHCDERGTNEYNLALGAKRAQSAKDYLASLGVVAGRLSTISYGEEVPVCREHNEECWQKNRRARFVVTTAPPGS